MDQPNERRCMKCRYTKLFWTGERHCMSCGDTLTDEYAICTPCGEMRGRCIWCGKPIEGAP